LVEEVILTFLSIFDECWVLQELQVIVLPIHENVGILRPALEHLVMDRFLAQCELIQDVGIQHVVFAEGYVLAKGLRVIKEHLSKGLTKHGSLG